MTRRLTSTLAALAVSSLTLGTVATGVFVVTADMAVAKNDNNNGGNGNGGHNGGGNGNRGGNSDASNNGHQGGGNSHANAKTNKGGHAASGGQASPKIFSDIAAIFSPKKSSAATKGQTAKAKAQQRSVVTAVKASPTPRPRGASGHGALASELKGLNAAHASATARANAAPNSQVGRIETYRALLDQATLSQDELIAAEDALLALQSGYDGRTTAEINDDIAKLDPLAIENEDALLALNDELALAETFEMDSKMLEGQIETLKDAETTAETDQADALLAASNGRALSPEALAELHRLLDLPTLATDVSVAEEEPVYDVDVATGESATVELTTTE
ncbi:hypothetical protein [Pseudogemmobacter sp. W21_MBD1_M6]|uniref:hypothetical protein n=1 Tax=Pseudogemmobacter sp. W21_MBD1_M6 TaxID=3240271 RepID=UPI003F9B3CCE